jgi:hypothetical protein
MMLDRDTKRRLAVVAAIAAPQIAAILMPEHRDALIGTVAGLGVLLMVRLEVVFRAREREIDRLFAPGRPLPSADEIDRAVGDDGLWAMLDLRRWTHRQLFPDAYGDKETANAR